MKKRGLASPDIADALALTFAFPVQGCARPRFPGAPFGAPMPAAAPNVVTDYDPYARLDPDFRFELD
jgi:hypothetical protein